MTENHSLPLLNLYYVLDPMCSWCWAFRNSWLALLDVLPESVNVKYVLGGLAPDSDQPMPGQQRQAIQEIWRTIERRTGTPFNPEFWSANIPRRSTYPACRAAIAAARLQPGSLPDMVYAIQKAYYLEARNPSDVPVLCDCAESIGLNREAFSEALSSAAVEQGLNKNLHLARIMGIQGFPAVLAVSQGPGEDKPCHHRIAAGWCDAETLVGNWRRIFPEAA